MVACWLGRWRVDRAALRRLLLERFGPDHRTASDDISQLGTEGVECAITTGGVCLNDGKMAKSADQSSFLTTETRGKPRACGASREPRRPLFVWGMSVMDGLGSSERDPMVKSRSKISRQPVKKSKKTAARTARGGSRENLDRTKPQPGPRRRRRLPRGKSGNGSTHSAAARRRAAPACTI